MHSIQSQIINITSNQQKRIDTIFTAGKIIDISKGLSNEKTQDSVIKVRDRQIKELEDKIELLKKEHVDTLVEIAKHNKTAEKTTNIVDKIADEQLTKERRKWLGLHLYSGIEFPRFEFNNLGFNTELTYELERFEIGLKGNFTLPPVINPKYEFNYYLKVSYKLF